MSKAEKLLLAAIAGSGLLVASGIVYLGNVVVEQRMEIAKINLKIERQQKDLNTLRTMNNELRTTVLRMRGGQQLAGR